MQRPVFTGTDGFDTKIKFIKKKNKKKTDGRMF